MEMKANQYYKKGSKRAAIIRIAPQRLARKSQAQQVVYQKKEEQLQAATKQQEQSCSQNGWQSLTVGNNGPVLAEDVLLHETLAGLFISRRQNGLCITKGTVHLAPLRSISPWRLIPKPVFADAGTESRYVQPVFVGGEQ